MARLLRDLLARFPVAVVKGHCHVPGAATQCPGFDAIAWWDRSVAADQPAEPEIEPSPTDGDAPAIRADRDRLRWRLASIRDLALRALDLSHSNGARSITVGPSERDLGAGEGGVFAGD